MAHGKLQNPCPVAIGPHLEPSIQPTLDGGRLGRCKPFAMNQCQDGRASESCHKGFEGTPLPRDERFRSRYISERSKYRYQGGWLTRDACPASRRHQRSVPPSLNSFSVRRGAGRRFRHWPMPPGPSHAGVRFRQSQHLLSCTMENLCITATIRGTLGGCKSS